MLHLTLQHNGWLVIMNNKDIGWKIYLFHKRRSRNTQFWSKCGVFRSSIKSHIWSASVEPGKSCWSGRLRMVDLLVLTSLDQLLFKLKILSTLRTKPVTLIRRSTVLSLPLWFVFPGWTHLTLQSESINYFIAILKFYHFLIIFFRARPFREGERLKMKTLRVAHLIVLLAASPAVFVSGIMDKPVTSPTGNDFPEAEKVLKPDPIKVQKCCEFDSILVSDLKNFFSFSFTLGGAK